MSAHFPEMGKISYMVTTRLAIDSVGMISNATKKTEAPNEALFLHFVIMFLSSKIHSP